MIVLPEFDKVAIQIGPLAVHWYGLTWMIGFLAAYWLMRIRGARTDPPWSSDAVGELVLFYSVLGALLGGRLGYVLFYGLEAWSEDLLWPLKIWQGGLSFHGGLLGVIAAMALYGHRHRRNFWDIADTCAPAVPIALGSVRIGNFINGELPGRITDVPWGVVVEGQGAVARHPSQLYQAFCEGVILWAVLWVYAGKPRKRGAVSAVFLMAYGTLRCFTEIFREPDAHIGFDLAGAVTRGQLLSIPLIILGALLWWRAVRGRGI
ncbi:MAG: prolipoprotein diacylglyceryl transferase [Gammaproteobacteria bacterium AqS3]|nr:prolipoprotein diacylglyceryl transferase [Gammaproteobacteria bacterium AqS3]